MIQRQQVIEQLRREPNVSVLIVGGGVNGAGLYRDLALQGIDALLIDKGDFCCGSSAGSSRMIHGGLRYLEFGEFRLVRESLKDRNLLLKNAPHYVFPLPTTIPVFKWISGAFTSIGRFLGIGGNRPAHRGLLMVKLGLTFYDLFTRGNRMTPKHKITSRKKTLQRRPALNPDLIKSATYYDAWISYPERLCLELLLDAEGLSRDVRSLNYMTLDSGEGELAVLRDGLTGETIEIQPKVVVNATGAWIDFTCDRLGLDTHLIGGTKGGHLIIDNQELLRALDGEMIYYETKDGRVSIAFPWLGKCLIGSTDIRIDDPDKARCDEDEVQYILDSIGEVFPKIKIERRQIVSRFTGVRPLAWTDPNQATVSASRDHKLELLGPCDRIHFPVYSMIGGKWTTFRVFAQQTTDALLKHFGKERLVGTEDLPIGGGKDFPNEDEERAEWVEELQERTGLSKKRIGVLLRRYGTRASVLAAFLTESDDQPLAHHADYTRREIEFLIQNERVMHLDDILLRRTSIALLGEATAELVEELATLLAGLREWSDQEKQAEIERTREVLRDMHGIEL